jgi:hypothetical protein
MADPKRISGINPENDQGYVAGYDVQTGEEIKVLASAMPKEPVHVPLVIYIGGVRRIIGDATVEGEQVAAHIHDEEPAKELCHLIENGVIQSVSVAFNAPPSTPVWKDGSIRWEKNY